MMLFSAFVAALAAGGTEPPVPPDHTRISALVRGADGKPLKGATVYIVAARARVGQSQLCPTCYPDCRRSATAGDDGRAAISDIDKNLIFTVVAVLDGYSPVLKASDDLLGDVLVFDLVPPDPKRLATGHVVRGLVVGPEGLPVKGAIVRPFGAKHAGQRWQGGGG